MIIEFNGLPGIGKTTVARGLGCAYKENRTVFFQYTDQRNKILKFLDYIRFNTFYLYYELRKYALCEIKPFDRQRAKYVWVILKYYQMYRRFMNDKPDDILIVDQGIIQGLLSIAHTGEIVSSKALKKIFNFFVKKKIIFTAVACTNNSEISYERIHLRGTKQGRMDIVEDEMLHQYLEKQTKTLNLINSIASNYSNITLVKIDTRKPVETNVDILVNEGGKVVE